MIMFCKTRHDRCREMSNESPPTARALNAMTDLEKIEFARSPFVKQLHMTAGSHVTTFGWSYVHATLGTQRWRNGSAFFIDIGGRIIAVTAAHVFRSYLKGKEMARGKIACQLGSLGFDPKERLIAVSDCIDIATFSVSADDLAKVGKQPFAVAGGDWPPPHPSPARPGRTGLTAYFAGFPEDSRLWINSQAISFGLYIAGGPIGSASDRQISMPFERQFWVDTLGLGFPPEGFDPGGISGGPMMMPLDKNGSWSFHLAGVIKEFPSQALGFETVIAAPAHYIAADGSINENSTPVRFAGPAE
jgi:hypothetical protein